MKMTVALCSFALCLGLLGGAQEAESDLIANPG